ncbi:aconitase X catalytic domain-containing protein [bacterium]|nr:aconitase X catalytic domain-containing protein [bacterium]
MRLTETEKRMLEGQFGEALAKSLQYIVQFGEAFDAEQLEDIRYCHYPAEMAIYEGSIEELQEFAAEQNVVAIPTTSSTLCADMQCPEKTGIPLALAQNQSKACIAHRKLGIQPTYTCTPQLNGAVPAFGTPIASVESSAIIFFNSLLGARANRGGLFTKFSAVTGKYPKMGYMLEENRAGQHQFQVEDFPVNPMENSLWWSALGFVVGSHVGSDVPVVCDLPVAPIERWITLGAAMATSGSVSLFHAVGHTPEAHTLDMAFQGKKPNSTRTIGKKELVSAIEQMTNLSSNEKIDFVCLGCPHYSLEQLRLAAAWLQGKKIDASVRFWICTSRMVRSMAQSSGYIKTIEESGTKVIADTCPVESHMRISTCQEYHLPIPQIQALVTDSFKMARYTKDLIGCKVGLTTTEKVFQSALEGRYLVW